jgi:Flp pilus assembly pilin Flp
MSFGVGAVDHLSIVGRSGERSCTVFLKPYIWLVGRREEGQTMAEYAVVLGVITLAVVGVFTALAGGISGAIDAVKSAI